MQTYAQISVRLLTEGAGFFRKLGGQSEAIQDQMEQNATIFDQVAQLMATNPAGRVGERSYAEMAAKLLRDAGDFFRTLAAHNESIRAEMLRNAGIYDEMAARVEKNPAGTLG